MRIFVCFIRCASGGEQEKLRKKNNDDDACRVTVNGVFNYFSLNLKEKKKEKKKVFFFPPSPMKFSLPPPRRMKNCEEGEEKKINRYTSGASLAKNFGQKIDKTKNYSKSRYAVEFGVFWRGKKKIFPVFSIIEIWVLERHCFIRFFSNGIESTRNRSSLRYFEERISHVNSARQKD